MAAVPVDATAETGINWVELLPPAIVVDEALVVLEMTRDALAFVRPLGETSKQRALHDILLPEFEAPARAGLQLALGAGTLSLSLPVAVAVGGVIRKIALQCRRLSNALDGQKQALITFIDAGDATGEATVPIGRIIESEERLRLANEAAGIGTFAIDAKTGMAHYSPELTTMLGIPGAETVPIQQAFQRIHRDDLQRVRRLYGAAQSPSGDGRLEMEFRFVLPGGLVRWMSWHGRFQFAATPAGREPIRIVGVCVDITQRKRAEDALKGSEARYRSVVEGSLQGIVIQQNERIVYANSAMARIFGYESAQDLLGKSTFDDFVAPEERELLRARTAAATRGEVVAPHPGWRGFRTDGREIWVSAMAHLAEWKEKPAVVSFYLDITERKLAERRLSESLRLIQLACAAGRMGTWHFDYSTLVSELSDEALELLGIDKRSWTKSLREVAAIVHPDDRPTWQKTVDTSITDKSAVDMEFRVVRPNGDVRWMLVRGTVVKSDEQGRFEAFGVILDISERKHAEQRQSILLQELDHRVKNSLANIQLVMERSSAQATSVDAFKAVLQERLMSMSMMHSRLSKGGWVGVRLADIINDALAPYLEDGKTLVEGAEIVLTPNASQAVAMVAFELATNAAKYGALLHDHGQVQVRWHLDMDETSPAVPKALVITWTESGGPTIAQPTRRGYGTSVIRELIPYELRGSKCSHAITSEGVACRIEIPARFLVRDSQA